MNFKRGKGKKLFPLECRLLFKSSKKKYLLGTSNLFLKQNTLINTGKCHNVAFYV